MRILVSITKSNSAEDQYLCNESLSARLREDLTQLLQVHSSMNAITRVDIDVKTDRDNIILHYINTSSMRALPAAQIDTSCFSLPLHLVALFDAHAPIDFREILSHIQHQQSLEQQNIQMDIETSRGPNEFLIAG